MSKQQQRLNKHPSEAIYCQHGVKISRSPNPQPRPQTKRVLVIETPKRPVGRPKKARVGENLVETEMLSDISFLLYSHNVLYVLFFSLFLSIVVAS